jgi:hypothetical protein
MPWPQALRSGRSPSCSQIDDRSRNNSRYDHIESGGSGLSALVACRKKWSLLGQKLQLSPRLIITH